MVSRSLSNRSTQLHSRRAVLAGLGVASLGLALASAGSPASARQDMTMPPGSNGITPQPLGGWQCHR